MIVTTVSGNSVPRKKCRKIKGEFYEIGVDCFLMSDNKYHRLGNGMVEIDFETNTPVFLREHPNISKGIVGFKNNSFIFGYFTPNIYKNIKVLYNGTIVKALNKNVLEKTNYFKNPLSQIYSEEGKFDSSIIDSEKLDYNCDSYLIRATKLFNYYKQNYIKKDINKNNIKYYSQLSLLDSKYLFGLEFETSEGVLCDTTLNKNGIIPVKDGSLRKPNKPLPFEYVTVPYQKEDLFNSLKEVCSDLNNNCKFDSSCSLHLHISGLENSKSNVVALWILIQKIQDEMLNMFPQYKTFPHIIDSNKNYCAKYNENLLAVNTKAFQYFELDTKEYINSYFSSIYHYISGGYSLDSSFNRSSLRHPNGNKWNIRSRYHIINLVTWLFSDKRTVEFRVHTPTFNYDKIINWVYICNAILKYVEKHSFSIIFKMQNNDIKLKDIINDVYGNVNASVASALINYIEYRKHNYYTKDGKLEFNTDNEKLPNFISIT